MSSWWSLAFALVSLNPATALSCWHLPPEHGTKEDLIENHEDYLQSKECPQIKAGEEPIYGCVTRVDRGEVRMECLNQRDGDSLKVCEKAVRAGKERCNYNKKLNFGYGHTDPGHGICCCPTDECNDVPPWWLVSDREVPAWRRYIDSTCFCIVVVTITMLFVAIEAVIETYVRIYWAKRKKTAKKEEATTGEPNRFDSVRDALDEGELPFDGQEVTSKNKTDPRKVDQQPAKSNGVNRTQSSQLLDLPLDDTPETTPAGLKPSVVLDKTQPTTRLHRQSNLKSNVLAKKSPSGTFGKLKKSNMKTSGVSAKKPVSSTAPSGTDVTQPEA